MKGPLPSEGSIRFSPAGFFAEKGTLPPPFLPEPLLPAPLLPRADMIV